MAAVRDSLGDMTRPEDLGARPLAGGRLSDDETRERARSGRRTTLYETVPA